MIEKKRFYHSKTNRGSEFILKMVLKNSAMIHKHFLNHSPFPVVILAFIFKFHRIRKEKYTMHALFVYMRVVTQNQAIIQINFLVPARDARVNKFS